jgi:hypothetical protein
MHDDAVLTLRGVEGSTDFEEADAFRCVPIIGLDQPVRPTRRSVTPCAAVTAPWLGCPDLCDP